MSARPLWFLAARYLRTRRKHRGAGSPLLSFLGLATGVLALNAVLSVMNGFQLTYIDSLIEVSSSHVRWTPSAPVDNATLLKLERLPQVVALLPETESQTLIASDAGRQRGAVLRGLPPDALKRDAGLKANLKLDRGTLPGRGQVALGAALAQSLGAYPGTSVSLTALSGPGFSLLAPHVSTLEVSGTFSTGYYEIDANWVIANYDDAVAEFAGTSDSFYSLKLQQSDDAGWIIPLLAQTVGRPESEFRGWSDFNSAFYGALRTEKTSMMVLVGLIFLVVGVNIYFSQKRAVWEHREDLALLQASGTSTRRLRLVFTLEGFLVGAAAAVLGTVAGGAVSMAVGSLGLFSSEAFYIPALPARMLPGEVGLIAVCALVSATLAAWSASGQVLKIPCGEVLKNA